MYRVFIDSKEAELEPIRVSAHPFNRVWPGKQRDISQTEQAYMLRVFGAKPINIDIVCHRLLATMDGLILAGVPEDLVYNSALVSIQGDVDKLSLVFAEKAIILSTQLAKRIPIK